MLQLLGQKGVAVGGGGRLGWTSDDATNRVSSRSDGSCREGFVFVAINAN